MPFLSTVLLLFLWAPALLAAPSGIQKRSFSIERVRNPAFKRRDGPAELLRTYRKYRMPIPAELLDSLGSQPDEEGLESKNSHLSALGRPRLPQVDDGVFWMTGAAAPGRTGRVSATLANGDVEYVSPIKIGGQTIHVVLDSGSADLWVFSAQLPESARAGHQVYDHTVSPTFRPMLGAKFSIRYGDGSNASGIVGTDTVDVGGATVTRQAVQMATAVSPAFARDPNLSGLVGLAFSQLNTVEPVKQRTFFENVMSSLAEPLFTANLRKDTVGAYEFGRVDATKFAGRLSWAPVDTSNGFWQILTTYFAVGNRATTQRVVSAPSSILDTGTTLMLVSPEIEDAYYGQIPGARRDPAAGGMTVPCNATLPDLYINVGGPHTARIRGDDINFGQFQGDSCFGGIQRTTAKFQVLGDVFFRSQFVVFHGGNRSVGMAPHI